MAANRIEAKMYARKMLVRGDNWAAVSPYLSRQELGVQGYSEIMIALRNEYNQGHI